MREDATSAKAEKVEVTKKARLVGDELGDAHAVVDGTVFANGEIVAPVDLTVIAAEAAPLAPLGTGGIRDSFGRKLSDGRCAGVKGMAVNSNLVGAFVAIPREVIWSYCVGGAVFAIGLAAIFLRGDWQKARGLNKLVLLGPIFYAAPLAAFGTEHFTLVTAIASIVPKWMPWHLFWAYFVGSCFIAAGFSMVTRIQARLAASLVALTFFLFVVLMDVPGWLQNPRDRFGITLALRELAFSGGALALAASLSTYRAKIEATIARYLVAIPVLFYSFEQFLHADHVPGVPLEPLTPAYIPGHAFWGYLPAVVYAAGGVLLVLGKKTRVAGTWVGASVLVVELAVYVPFAVAERASIVGLNFWGDTLMFCGAVLLMAGAMPHEKKGEGAAPSDVITES